jgi:hypothetical protein
METKVICRKCGGPHFTIKCGKEQKSTKDNTRPKDNIETKTDQDIKTSTPNTIIAEPKNNRFNSEHIPREKKFRKTYRIKISELPTDMTEEEMMELTCDWGHITKIKIITYNETSVAYIDFGYEDEANYFVEAIDKTPFDYLLLSVCRVDVN